MECLQSDGGWIKPFRSMTVLHCRLQHPLPEGRRENKLWHVWVMSSVIDVFFRSHHSLQSLSLGDTAALVPRVDAAC